MLPDCQGTVSVHQLTFQMVLPIYNVLIARFWRYSFRFQLQLN